MIRNALEELLRPYTAALAGEEMNTQDPIYSLLQPRTSPRRAPGAPTGGATGSLMEQFRQGFLDAGRPDLAKMVGTPAFETWLGQESGMNPRAVSPANNQGLRNGGAFQFWYGHDFSDPYEGKNRFTMPADLQAFYAATQFDLDPSDIRSYARQIRRGTYEGWG